jgi:four helix bundle protein
MPRPIRDFRDLGAWQCAMDLAIACADVCEQLPRFETFLIEQLRHAANTVHASIAEGNGRPTTPDYLRFLGTASSSLNEVRSHLLYIERRFPSIAAARVALEHAERTSRPLQGLIKSLREKLHRERKRNPKWAR